MRFHTQRNSGDAQPTSHPIGESHDTPNGGHNMARLALSHTPVEHQLYRAMRAETAAAGIQVGSFSARHLMILTGLSGYSSIRRWSSLAFAHPAALRVTLAA